MAQTQYPESQKLTKTDGKKLKELDIETRRCSTCRY